MNTNTQLIERFNSTLQDQLPILHFCSPSVELLSQDSCIIKLPLNQQTRSHIGAMSFAALGAGADCAGGLLVMLQVMQSKQKINFLFTKAQINFLKKADDDVFFTCNDGDIVASLLTKTLKTKAPHSASLFVEGVTKSHVVTTFELELFLNIAD